MLSFIDLINEYIKNYSIDHGVLKLMIPATIFGDENISIVEIPKDERSICKISPLL